MNKKINVPQRMIQAERDVLSWLAREAKADRFHLFGPFSLTTFRALERLEAKGQIKYSKKVGGYVVC